MTESASTYFVQDPHNKEELTRLLIQDQAITAAIGGILPEQKDPAQIHRVLDIACGPGGWAIDAAQAYPHMQLYGVDISPAIIDHARKRAEDAQLSTDRVEFIVMNALRKLEFPDDFFDLANFRFGLSFMRQQDWPNMLSEMKRIVKPAGIVRIVEGEAGLRSSSAALTKFYALIRQATYCAGHLFKEDLSGLIDELPGLLMRSGFQKIQSRKHTISYRTGITSGDAFVQSIILFFQTAEPYLDRYGCLPEDYHTICQQATKDMQQPGFVMTHTLVTLWATNPKTTNGSGEIY
jgi:ubiquinone/menaquinone biosynthesis C-methylase UbiE